MRLIDNMEKTYRIMKAADDPGIPLSHQRVRALLAPPGVPKQRTGTRLLEAGRVELVGRAWAGMRSIATVSVSTDDGKSWREALLGKQEARYAWRSFNFNWNATPGLHTIAVRATDNEGESQPMEPIWNYRGMGNNAVQRTIVEVVERYPIA